jgi:asparagine synthase (glutamine-hydrolysing)
MEGIIPDRVLYRKKSPYPKTWHPEYLALVKERFDRLLEDHRNPVFQIVDRNALVQLAKAEAPWPWYGQLMRLPQTMAYILQLEFWLREYKVSLV